MRTRVRAGKFSRDWSRKKRRKIQREKVSVRTNAESARRAAPILTAPKLAQST